MMTAGVVHATILTSGSSTPAPGSDDLTDESASGRRRGEGKIICQNHISSDGNVRTAAGGGATVGCRRRGARGGGCRGGEGERVGHDATVCTLVQVLCVLERNAKGQTRLWLAAKNLLSQHGILGKTHLRLSRIPLSLDAHTHATFTFNTTTTTHTKDTERRLSLVLPAIRMWYSFF
jgi:hypothetical protein